MSPRLRMAAVALLGLAALALAGCSHSPGPEANGCSPGRPHVSQDVARPGDRITVSVSAVACAPTFDDGGDLVLTFQDRAGHRSRLATVHAHPSGAFEQEVVIPRTASAGGGDLSISGVEWPCADTGSCAEYATSVDVVDPRPDFAASSRANGVAAGIAAAMQASLEHRRSFAGIAIVPDGIEVVLHTERTAAETAAVQRAFDAARRAVPAANHAFAAGAHLHITRILHSDASLERLTMRIAHDSAWQQRHHLELSRWSADTATDSVRISLRSYSDAAARLLIARYGTAVSVSTTDTPFAVAS